MDYRHTMVDTAAEAGTSSGRRGKAGCIYKNDLYSTMIDRAATEGHLALALRWRSVQAWTTDIHGRQSSNKGTPRAGAALALGKGMDYRHTMVDTAAEAGNSRGRRGKAGGIFKNDL